MAASTLVPTSPDPELVHRSENKFYAFFRSRSRSRSRSRPHNNPTPSDLVSSNLEPLPSPLPSTFHSPKDSPSSDNPPSSYTKSSVRSQTRPISSTTTATHSTITPLPSDSLRRRFNARRHEYLFRPHSTDTHTSLGDHDQRSDICEYDSDDHRFPRSETPSSTRRKLALHTFFGISLTRRSSSTGSTPHPSTTTSERKASTSTSASEPRSKSSRKRSFRLASRPDTPKSIQELSSSKSPYSIPVPSSPLPLSASPRRRSFGLGGSHRSTPKSSTGNLPLPHVQSGQSRSHVRRCSVGSERPPHDSAVALPEEPSHRSVHKSGHVLLDVGARNKGKEKEHLFLDSDRSRPASRPSMELHSQSLPANPSPISEDYLSSQFSRHPAGHADGARPLTIVESVPSEENEQSSLLAPRLLPVIPRIIHTPPTPQRPGEVDSPSRPGTSPPRMDSDKVKIAKGKATVHREQILVSSSRSHTDVHANAFKDRFTPRLFSGKDLPKAKDTGGQTSSRRAAAGSPDGHCRKTPGSNVSGPARNMMSHRSKLGSFDFERPVSTFNGRSSTVDRSGIHVTKDNSSHSKTGLHSLDRTISEDSSRGGKSRLVAYHPAWAESPILSPLKPDRTGDTSVVSFSSVSVQTKSTGKGIGTNTAEGRSSSWGRASGRHVLGSSHGTFAFEHPAAVPSSPNPKNFNLPSEPNQRDVSEHLSDLPQSQPTSPLYGVFDTRAKHSRWQSYNPSEYVGPGYSKFGECKFKGKGRSLDLGLGLSWAPSRVREEVLMPGLILARERAKMENKRANGSDVTRVFESLLSESRFQAFKKYVHRFDAHIIPLEGPSGLLVRVEKLLAESGLNERERNKLMSEFTVFVEGHNG